MIIVRFPNGQAVRYNSGYTITKYEDGLYVVDSKGYWIARIPDNCVAEAATPCRVYNPLTDNVNEELKALAKELRSLKRKVKG
jgi:hypothetical protein